MTEVLETHVYPVRWQGDHVLLIDQTKLPKEYAIVSINRWEDILTAIQTRIVRGGPALGMAAAYGLYLGAQDINTTNRTAFLERLEAIAELLKSVRPNKANVLWSVDRQVNIAQQTSGTVDELKALLLETAQTIQQEDWEMCVAIGQHGLTALPETPEKLTLYTHCNHGALATSGFGTSLGIVRTAWQEARLKKVIAGETRPWLQGSRLTAWECVQETIPVTVVTDSMAAHCMTQNMIDAVIVGADRIAVNGDTVNKIGTYGLALAAKAHNIPFLVAASLSTVDFTLTNGDAIKIAQGSETDICRLGDTVTCPSGVNAYNPLVDVTPADLITAIVTERGAIAPARIQTLAPPIS
ncbi:S-methyl-5-thioribose-1-phosphate isomerase [Oscillatoria sp. CS-180]|uniref:S-methyl-5-thioribose-1-phosphate isomerase n=1 Tax=Oscillatoria sp. CS-180 TaxID=3021720 RepID=UPI00232AE57F|nr:S-methyl-5-thioribose-1-phosphate isomerase [Oscillatoria sp. CS-180]MDB9526672.1 S-methyl-5-thioribose-1-phosphate isomerase [Oscillatoria sp. CS-180]